MGPLAVGYPKHPRGIRNRPTSVHDASERRGEPGGVTTTASAQPTASDATATAAAHTTTTRHATATTDDSYCRASYDGAAPMHHLWR